MKTTLARWASAQKPVTLLALQLIAAANAFLLATIGALYLTFASRPGGLIVAASAWTLAALLVAFLHSTGRSR